MRDVTELGEGFTDASWNGSVILPLNNNPLLNTLPLNFSKFFCEVSEKCNFRKSECTTKVKDLVIWKKIVRGDPYYEFSEFESLEKKQGGTLV